MGLIGDCRLVVLQTNIYRMLKTWVVLLVHISPLAALLHIQKNEIRTFDSLDGLWTFVREPHNGGDVGIENLWNTLDLSKFDVSFGNQDASDIKVQNATVMPVPAAYNDLGTSSELRDHIGWVWYEKKEFVPLRDKNMRHVLRFGSVNYFAVVVSSSS